MVFSFLYDCREVFIKPVFIKYSLVYKEVKLLISVIWGEMLSQSPEFLNQSSLRQQNDKCALKALQGYVSSEVHKVTDSSRTRRSYWVTA